MRCIAVVGAGASAPLLRRADALADSLEARFGRDKVELERLELVTGSRARDFETRLVALSGTPVAAREVRDQIAKLLGIRHPALLSYELLAHLVKHRFLDAIISFNFDELLDQSLEDELDPHEFHRIISERDCAGVETDPEAPSYQPLYIKLHGTTSEPESLRFTADSYYALPPRVVNVVRDLMRVEHCVIVNLGAGLGSFDFQRLLRGPANLSVFDLSKYPFGDRVVEQIGRERRKGREQRWHYDCTGSGSSCHTMMGSLTEAIDRSAKAKRGTKQIVKFRSVRRHETVTQLLGKRSLPKKRRPADEADHLYRRGVLELALAGAKSRGLLSLGPLATDRPARYFDEYRRLTNGHGHDWRAFCSAAGLVESETVPDVLLSERSLRKDPADYGAASKDHDASHYLHDFAPKLLARHVLARVCNPPEPKARDLELLRRTIKQLQRTTDTEIHTHDDRVCSKAFRRPMILPTATALHLYTWLMLQDLEPKDRICVSSETGEWLLSAPMRGLLQKQRRLDVLVAFGSAEGDLRDRFGGLEVRSMDPWHHNRHMTIVFKKGRPARAIYFARRLRSPIITPVYVDGIRDVQRLMTTFKVRWKQARPLPA
jgi:hypothetical protein